MRHSRFLAGLSVAVLGAASTALAAGGGSVSESFADDPVVNSRATINGSASRFTFAAGKVTAHYDSAAATAKLLIALPVGVTLDQNTPFTFSATFTIDSLSGAINDSSSFLGTSQIAMGLQNQATLNNRTNYPTQDAYDLLTVDYFPTVNFFSSKPTLAPTLVESPDATITPPDYYKKIDFAFGEASKIAGFLQTGIAITATTSYDPGTHVLTTVFSSASPLYAGGPTELTQTNDLDLTSVASDEVAFQGFNLNQIGLFLWDDSASITAGYDSAFSADVSFTNLSVTWEATPEPASIGVLAIGAAGLMLRRRRTAR